MTLTLSLSPTFQLTRDGEPVPLKNKKAQALLVYLSLTDRPQTREHLATLLWGDRFDEQARNSLRQALFALRKAVGGGVIVGDDSLTLDAGRINIAEDGDLLPGFSTGAEGFDGWLQEARADVRDRQIRALLQHAEKSLAQRAADDADDAAREVLSLDPFHEEALRLRMRALAGLGRRSEAVRVYDAFTDRLVEELAVEPSSETIRLAADLRDHAEVVPEDNQPKEDTKFASIMVADFDNLGGGEIAEFLAHEIPREIVRALTPNEYASIGLMTDHLVPEEGKSQREVARKYGAYHLFTGSVRQIGDKVRINVQHEYLTDGRIIWSNGSTIPKDEAFDFLDHIHKEVTGQFTYMVRQDEEGALATLRDLLGRNERITDHLQEYNDAFWAVFFRNHTRLGFDVLTPIARELADRNPDSVHLLCLAATAQHHHVHLSDRKDRAEGYRTALDYLYRARALEPLSQGVRHGLTMFSNWQGRFEDVEAAYQDMMENRQDIPSIHGLYGTSLMFRGRFAEAIPLVNRTVRRESGIRFLMYRYPILSLCNFFLGDYDQAERLAHSGLEVSEEFWLGHLAHIAALHRLGRTEDAAHAVDRFRLNYRGPTVSEWEWLPFEDPAHRDELLNALREAGLPE